MDPLGSLEEIARMPSDDKTTRIDGRHHPMQRHR